MQNGRSVRPESVSSSTRSSRTRSCSRGIFETYRHHDYVSARIDEERRIVEVPRPAGVVLALTPSTNPVSTVYFKILLSLMTRNAVVVSPHPMARECCVDAARLLADAAVRAGAPDGCIQVVEEPTIPLIEALMADVTTDVIVATGGVGVVRAAYHSGNPALGVGPGNVPVLVDATADLARAARCIVDSKAFDNSILCTNESVLIAEERIADRLERELTKQGAHICSERRGASACARRSSRTADWRLDLVGQDAADAGTRGRHPGLAAHARADRAVPPRRARGAARTREAVPACSASSASPDARRGIDAARAMVRIGGAGHSAVIHSARSAHDHGLRRRRRRAACRGQRGRQHRLVGLRHEPRALDDDRHRLRRPQLARREPRAAAPRQPGPGSPTARDPASRRSRDRSCGARAVGAPTPELAPRRRPALAESAAMATATRCARRSAGSIVEELRELMRR